MPAETKRISVIPKPATVRNNGEPYYLNDNTGIYYNDQALQDVAVWLQETLQASTSLPLPIHKKATGRGISLILDTSLADKIEKEEYRLSVLTEGVKISATTPRGIIWGAQTFRQLLPTDIFADRKVHKTKWEVPGIEITDKPRFSWRGMMLDSSRTFQSVEFIKRYIDLLSIHKINIFHWHLTDDQGWRIEIKAYPKLTETGSVRGGDYPLQHPEWISRWMPENEISRGYYTQDEIRDIVKFAKSRGIDILPEIDLPGHSRPAAVTYPEILCRGESESLSVQGEKENVWCASRKENYEMMEKILQEVAALFPFEYIHIGGDEVNTNSWKHCESCNKLAENLHYEDAGQLQPYVTQQLEKICSKLGKKLVGWNEIMENGISKNTCIMSWSGTEPGYKAASAGHPVVMVPGPFSYFDMAQRTGERGHFWAGIVTTEKVYSFDPLMNPELSEKQLNNIIGVHACLWTEFCTERPDILKRMNIDEQHALTAGSRELPAPEGFTEHQTFPRLCALSEQAWTPQKQRSIKDFKKRLGEHLKRLDMLNVHYRIPTPHATVKNGIVTVEPPFPEAEVRYTTDGTHPDNNSILYTAPFHCSEIEKLKLVTIAPNGRISLITEGASPAPVAEWNSTQLSTEPQTLVFDITGNLTRSGNWWVDFLYTSGTSSIEISKVSLYENGTLIATDSHTAVIGPETPDGNGKSSYRIRIKKFKQDANYAIEAKVKGLLKTDNIGIVNLFRSDYDEPNATFTTEIPERPGYSPELAADWNRKTYYMTNRPPKKEETFTWTFTTPLPVSAIEIQTGNPGTTDNILVDAILQISEDGKTFQDCTAFTYGSTSVTTENPIKGMRIKVTNNQTSKHIAIQDPFISIMDS